MYLSDKDLKQFTSHSLAPEKLARLLTEKVVEVEGLHRWDLDNIVVGEVKAIHPHPQADRLRLIEVSVGDRSLTIVCGGKNIYIGELVPLALEGAKFRPHGKGDTVKLESATIRGVKSEGMICAAAELDLPVADRAPDRHPEFISGSQTSPEMLKQVQHDDKATGPFILDLTRFIPTAKAGTPLAKALGMDDVRYEIDNKSLARRADLWGYWGMSREVAAISDTHQKPLLLATLPWSTKHKRITILDKKGCPQSAVVEVENIVVEESPWEVKRRLMAAGMNSVNIIVDITNIVMLETGQPMHAFDRNRVPKIVIRKARNAESIRVLNGREYTLTVQDCVITDGKDPVDIAGVIGGDNTGVSPDTTAIALTLCSFEPVMIRKTSQRFQLRTEASARFEKGQAVEMVDIAARRFVWYLKKYQPNARLVSCERQGRTTTPKRSVRIDWPQMDALIGVGVVSPKEARKLLESIGFTMKGLGNKFTVGVPFWRNDIEIPADVAEEVSRLYGFNNIAHALPSFPIEPARVDATHTLIDELKTFLVERCSFTETESYPFAQSSIPAEYPRFKVVSPISAENTELRDDLVPAVVSGVAKNLRHFNHVRMFEIGREYQPENDSDYPRGTSKSPTLPYQPIHCVGAIAIKGASDDELFLMVKGVVEAWAQANHHQLTWAAPKDVKGISSGVGYEPGRVLTIILNGHAVGNIGLIINDWRTRLECDLPVAIFDMQVDLVMASGAGSAIRYQSASPYPSVLRDLALVVDTSVPYERIAQLFSSHGNFLQKFELFDSYQGKEVGEGKKSLAFHLTFCDSTRTLTNQEVDASMEKILKMCQNELGAAIR